MKLLTEKLTGRALIWAVAKALGFSPVIGATGICYQAKDGEWVYPTYDDDNKAGQLIVQEWISVERPSRGQTVPVWRAITENKVRSPRHYQPVVAACGTTLGDAVCRVLAVSRLGEHVDIPDELCVIEEEGSNG